MTLIHWYVNTPKALTIGIAPVGTQNADETESKPTREASAKTSHQEYHRSKQSGLDYCTWNLGIREIK